LKLSRISSTNLFVCVTYTGKNRGLGGLAAAIVKLWEKSEIVKIGVKRGVQNTSNERMAEELKVRTLKFASLSCHVVIVMHSRRREM